MHAALERGRSGRGKFTNLGHEYERCKENEVLVLECWLAYTSIGKAQGVNLHWMQGGSLRQHTGCTVKFEIEGVFAIETETCSFTLFAACVFRTMRYPNRTVFHPDLCFVSIGSIPTS